MGQTTKPLHLIQPFFMSKELFQNYLEGNINWFTFTQRLHLRM